jgi:hypothetical protein
VLVIRAMMLALIIIVALMVMVMVMVVIVIVMRLFVPWPLSHLQSVHGPYAKGVLKGPYVPGFNGGSQRLIGLVFSQHGEKLLFGCMSQSGIAADGLEKVDGVRHVFPLFLILGEADRRLLYEIL